MKNTILLCLTCILLLSACAPKFEQEEEIIQETNDTKEKAIIPRYNISESYYRTILPFKPGNARGLVVGRVNNRLDIDEFETGLMRIAQDSFDVNKYLYQEGQYLDKETIRSWLNRKYTKEQLAEAKLNDEQNVGLNPVFEEKKGTAYENQIKDSPMYLAHILEHNYLVKNDEGQVELGGVVIGLALNSVYYYNLPNDGREFGGYPRETEISTSKLKAEGKRIAEEVIKRVRNIDGLKGVPIEIALFQQEETSSIVPGSFISKASVDAKSSKIGKWEDINEEYYFFHSSSTATSDYPDDSQMFARFKADIDEFFPNYTGVIGQGFYANEELQELTIKIPMQFYGKAEVIGFTQWVTGLVMEHFPQYIDVRVYISSESGPESIITRDKGDDEPFVHIYN